MYIGQSLPMPDAVERVSGTVPFAINLELPEMLHGKVLRSPFPHARVVRIDTRPAQALPGVVAVLSRADLGPDSPLDPFWGTLLKDHQVVAIEKVRYVGEPVAAVAAVDPDTAKAALDLIEVEYEELPAVFNEQDAVHDGAPLVNEGIVKTHPGPSRVPIRGLDGTNVFQTVRIRHGDVEQGFRESDHIFEHTFTTPAVHHAALEPHVTVAQVEDGHITIWSATQAPYRVRKAVADVFRLSPEQVRLIVPPIGGGFGAKSHIKLEPLAAALAWMAGGRPVKIVLSRAESFVQITKHAATLALRTGVKRDGTLVARQATIYWNGGAYSDTSPIVARNGAITCFGPYRLPHAWSDSFAVYTNTPPAGSYRAPAVLEVTWAGESQLDIIARELGLDPVEFRLKNLLEDGDTFITGETMDDVHFKELLRDVAESIGWGMPAAPDGRVRRGCGVAVTIKSTATPSTSNADIRLGPDGTCTLLVSTVELGQGSKVVLSQIAADALGIPLEQVRIVHPDTAVTPFDMATNSSRSTFSMGNALRLAAQDVKRRLAEAAVELLEARSDDLVVEGGRVHVRGSADRGLSWGEVVQRSGHASLTGSAAFTTQGGLDPETYRGVASVHWHQGAGAAAVEVDEETGQVRVTDFHAAVYAGQVINPATAALQTHGNVVMGLGVALSEELIYDGGQMVNANLGDYLIPSIVDVPARLTSSELEHPDGSGEIHGVAENTIPTVAPAVANAVAAATEVRIFDLPLTAEKVLRKIRERSSNDTSSGRET
ncbi:MAG: xanthine dehydrogenase family protein molybdopterin-binding subunit [Anaerolineae bacterium]